MQALRRLICLCPDCHRTTHFGRANVTGQADTAFAHLCAVTGTTAGEVRRHIDDAGELAVHRAELLAEDEHRGIHDETEFADDPPAAVADVDAPVRPPSVRRSRPRPTSATTG